MSKRCMGCMNIIEDDYHVCPKCGFVEGTGAAQAIHMEPGTIFHNRYVIGKVLGNGSFGVTYIAWDGKLEQKVAIKEYLPSEFSTRVPGQSTVTNFKGEKSEQFNSGLKKFVEEAKKLAKFQNEQGIVTNFDSFEEYGTAYIIMEYLDGMTLAQYLKIKNVIPPDDAVELLMPVMKSLQVVHAEGILHRDIAPDNIFITKEGQCKLIDFGASRFATTDNSLSMTVIVKQGYSPEEQYLSRGKHGPASDVYALGATLYKMITGVTPPDALLRRAKYEGENKDILTVPHKLNKRISASYEVAILNAMNIMMEDRTPDVNTFISELMSYPPAKRRYGKIKKIDLYRWPLWVKGIIAASMLCLVTFGTLLATGVIKFDSNYSTKIEVPDNVSVAPNVEGMDKDSATSEISKKKLTPMIVGNISSEYIEAGKILLQDPSGGSYLDVNGIINLTVSSGSSDIKGAVNGISTVPYILGNTLEEAKESLMKAGLSVGNIKEEYDDVVAAGLVMKQSLDAGKETKEGTKIDIVISKGSEGFEMPDLKGMTEADAANKINSLGLVVNVEYGDDNNAKVGEVYAQSVAAGQKVTNGTVIKITVKSDKKLKTVPGVVGKTRKNAKSILESEGYEVVVLENYSDDVESGYVISQTPRAGSSQEAGSKVTIYVSKGSKPQNTETPPGSQNPPTTSQKDTEKPKEQETTTKKDDKPAAKKYTVTFNANGGSVSSTSKTLSVGDKYGDMPTPARDYYNFAGWYTAAQGGNKVDRNSTFSNQGNQTLYAQWNEKPLSGWTMEGNVPRGAKVVQEKWTYEYIDYKESNSPTMAGYERYDTKENGISWGAWSGWTENQVTASETRQVETTKQAITEVRYSYDKWSERSNGLGVTGPWKGYWRNGTVYCGYHFETGLIRDRKPVCANDYAAGQTIYIYGVANVDTWYNEQVHNVQVGEKTLYRYRDGVKTYTYYFRKTENRESNTEVLAQGQIQNVIHWIKYREK